MACGLVMHLHRRTRCLVHCHTMTLHFIHNLHDLPSELPDVGMAHHRTWTSEARIGCGLYAVVHAMVPAVFLTTDEGNIESICMAPMHARMCSTRTMTQLSTARRGGGIPRPTPRSPPTRRATRSRSKLPISLLACRFCGSGAAPTRRHSADQCRRTTLCSHLLTTAHRTSRPSVSPPHLPGHSPLWARPCHPARLLQSPPVLLLHL